MKQRSPVMVAQDQDSGRHGHQRKIHNLVEQLKSNNVPAVPSKTLRIDLMWTVHG